MRLLTVVDGIGPPAARGVDMIYELQCQLASLGVEVHILTVIDFLTPPDWREWMEGEHQRTGVHFHVIERNAFKQSGKLGTPRTRLAYAAEVVRLSWHICFDIVHEYSSAPILFYRTGLYKLLLGVRAFHTICAHNDSFLGSLRFWGGVRFLDRVICSSRHLRDTLIAYGCPADRLTYLSYGVDTGRFQRSLDRQELRQMWGLPLDRPVVLYVGPLEDHKGAFVFAQALTKLARRGDVAFLVVTHRRVPAAQHVENRRRFLKAITPVRDRVVMLEGVVDIPSAMAVADIVALPLKTGHGTAAQPLTLLEAMAAGKAIVASALNGVVELIRDGEAGLLCSPGDAAGLADALDRLISDTDLRQHLSERASEKAKRECDVKIIAPRLLALYQRALSDALRSAPLLNVCNGARRPQAAEHKSEQ